MIPRFRLPLAVAVPVIILCGACGFMIFYISAAQLARPDVPTDYLARYPWRNTIACLVGIAIGLALELVAVVTAAAALRRSLLERKGP